MQRAARDRRGRVGRRRHLLRAVAGIREAPDVFVRYEEDAQAEWAVVEDCGDGTPAQVFVSVIGGLEFESPDLVDVHEFLDVQVRVSRCDGTFVSGCGNGPAADHQGSPTLRRTRVIGTVTLDGAAVASVDVRW